MRIDPVALGRAIWAVVIFLGYKSIIAAALAWALGSSVAVVEGMSWPVAVMAGFCVFVAALYLVKAPAFYHLLVQANPNLPNHKIWRHKPRFTLLEAACLLADRSPPKTLQVPEGDPHAWFQLLRMAISDEELEWVGKPPHTPPGWQAGAEVQVKKSDLKNFAHARGRYPEFLAD